MTDFRPTDTQLVILSAAEARDDGAIFPLPKSLKLRGAARKARAQLRRATGPSDILAVEATQELYAALRKMKGIQDLRVAKDGPGRLALIAATLAAVEVNGNDLPKRFGQLEGERRALSHLRSQRIIRARDPWQLAVLLRRALPLVERTANVGALGADLLIWNDTVRNRWCFDYFGAAPPDSPDPQGTRTAPQSAPVINTESEDA